MAKETVLKGIVKWFNPAKGYGFIKPENGDDIFVHYSDIDADGYRNLDEGDVVSFEIGESDRGKKAVKVRKN